MELLAVRIGLPALTMFLATGVQRRFGHRLGGRFVGLPLTTGPFLLVLCLADGGRSAGLAARGALAGQLGVVAFCAGYALLARRTGRRPAVLAGALAITVAADAVAATVPSPYLSLALVLAAAALALHRWPVHDGPTDATAAPAWEAPVRMGATVTVVATMTAAAPLLGAHLAGVLACLPVLLSIMVPATHRRHGRIAATSVLRGTVASVPATAVFVAVLAVVLPGHAGAAWLLAGAVLVLGNVAMEARRPPSRRAASDPRAQRLVMRSADQG